MAFSDLRVGLIGAGGISHDHVQAWLALGAHVTAYSRSGAPGLVAAYDIDVAASIDELLQTSDIVDICTPTLTHPEMVRAAIEARVPIICEKPLAITEDLAAELVAEAAAAQVPLYPAHVIRYFPEYVAAKQAVDAGALGNVAVSRFRRAGEAPSWAPWLLDPEQSGGIVLDQMIHDIDIAGWISGPVVRVFGAQSAPAEGSSAVSAQLQLTHASGALSFVTGVWGAPSLGFSTSFSIAGDDGVIGHDSRDETTMRVDIGAPEEVASDRPDSSLVESPYLTQLRELARGIHGELDPRVTGTEGVAAVRVARAAIRSIETGQPVDIVIDSDSEQVDAKNEDGESA